MKPRKNIMELKVGEHINGGPLDFCQLREVDGKKCYVPFHWGDFIDGAVYVDDLWENINWSQFDFCSYPMEKYEQWPTCALEDTYDARYSCGALTKDEMEAA